MLDEKGAPTPLVHTVLCPPRSRMDILSPQEIDSLVQKSKLVSKYNQVIDNKSAYEILNEKLDVAAHRNAEEKSTSAASKKATKEESIFDNPIVKQVERTAATVITRSLLGALGVSNSTRRRKSSSWF